jgi:hypothetical protein
VKPYAAGTPYTAKRANAIQSRLDQLARRTRMDDLLVDGVDAFVGFQDQLANLQAEIQRDIGILKKTVRKNKQQVLPVLSSLRRLLWYSRCMGDALAWQVLVYDRKAVAALMHGTRPPVAEATHNTKAVFAMAGHFLGQQFGVPIVHDITNWLRIGDITFLRFNDEPFSWRFQTVELKSSLGESTVSDAGIVEATVTVNVYSNEPMELSPKAVKQAQSESDTIPREQNENQTQYRQDRRLEKQFRRLDQMVALREIKENAITVIDGVPNLVFRLPDEESHHWSDLRRAIRNARRDGFAFFSIDRFIGYGLFYRKEGVTDEHISNFREPYVEHIKKELLAAAASANDFLLVRQLPMLEEYDTEGFPIMRFFSYKIPKVAIIDFLRNRLLVTAVVNFGRLDNALVDEGFTVSGINSQDEDEAYSYSVEVAWPTGDAFRVKIPSAQVSREVERALYEFSGLDDVVRKVASVKLLPELISYEDWEASLKSTATDAGLD